MPKYEVSNLNAIVINYFTCFTLGSFISGSIPLNSGIIETPWFPYALFLSMCFIIFFNVNAYTIQKVGMIITSIFQKLSLIFPVIVGILFFSETAGPGKKAGIALAVLAIIFINLKTKSDQKMMESLKKYWFWPFIVLFGSGLIEVTLFYIEHTGKVTDAGLPFVSILFFLAGCWGMIFKTIKRSLHFSKQDIIAGIALGIPNFFTIYLIIRGLELGWQGSELFPVNNLGVIVFTTILGIIIFKEKLNRLNYLGIGIALVAVWLISS